MGLQEVQAHVFQSSSFVVFELRPGSDFYDNHRSANALLFQASNFKTVGLLSCDTFRNNPSGLCQAHIQVFGAEAFSQDCDFSKQGRLFLQFSPTNTYEVPWWGDIRLPDPGKPPIALGQRKLPPLLS